jgi:uncharacterized protein YcbK (DUF882 family)
MKNFKPEEFMCSCGCGGNKMESEFLEKLDAAREIAGIPFVISSGYRCPKHNKEVGSTATNHPLGVASDIRCTDGASRFKIIAALIQAGFTRIGVAKTFIHCDTNTLPSSIWFY